MYTRTATSKDEFATTSPAIPRAGDGGAEPGSGWPFNWKETGTDSGPQEALTAAALLTPIRDRRGPRALTAAALLTPIRDRRGPRALTAAALLTPIRDRRGPRALTAAALLTPIRDRRGPRALTAAASPMRDRRGPRALTAAVSPMRDRRGPRALTAAALLTPIRDRRGLRALTPAALTLAWKVGAQNRLPPHRWCWKSTSARSYPSCALCRTRQWPRQLAQPLRPPVPKMHCVERPLRLPHRRLVGSGP